MSNVIEVQFGAKKQKSMKAAQYTRDIDATRQQPYRQKFASFHKLCDEAASGAFDAVIVAFPEVLGDNNEELVSNLSRAASAGLLIAIAGVSPFRTH
jgi:anaerobic glycerol-3-phosphate dehydrogenase